MGHKNDAKYHFIAFDGINAKQFSSMPENVPVYNLENVFELQEPLYYEDWISETDCNHNSLKIELDEFLRNIHSFLIYKCLDD